MELYRKAVALLGFFSVGAWIGIGIAITLVTTGAAMAVIVWLPADHFVRRPPTDIIWDRYTLGRFLVVAVKNVFGFFTFLLGIVMVPAPGPGLVVMAIGLSLLDFPGKRALERRLLGNPGASRFITDMRALFGKPPLLIDADGTVGQAGAPQGQR